MTSAVSSLYTAEESDKICGIYRRERLLFTSAVTQLWTVVDDGNVMYTAKMTRLDPNGNPRRSFVSEYNTFFVLTKGSIRCNSRLNIGIPRGFPKIFFIGRHRNEYSVIIMERFFSNLYNLRNDVAWSSRYANEGYLVVADDMFMAVMNLHRHGLIHRNVKPQNFSIGNGTSPLLLDFSTTKSYLHPMKIYHAPFEKEQTFVGSIKYASIYAHLLYSQSRRDDLISLGYSIIDVMKKGLPWDTVVRDNFSEMCSAVLIEKQNTSLRTLCQGLPNCILEYMQAVTTIAFDATPDYNLLREILNR